MESTIASSLEGTRFEIFEQIWSERLAALDIGLVLVYIIDTVNEAALPYLAEQFDVLGYKGWDFTTTTQERRDLIKRAIELHRTKGTPFAIKQSLRQIGFLDAEIQEGGNLVYDGSIIHNGDYQYLGGSWAYFSVILDLGNQKGITPERSGLLRLLIDEYKAARCRLTSIQFRATILEEVETAEQLAFNAAFNPIEETIPTEVLYNSVFRHDSSVKHSGSTESFDLTANFVFSETITVSEPPMPITQTFTNGTIVIL
jgi:phage tail P2-like protein